MQIVTDRGCDLSPAQLEGLNLHFVSMKLTLDGKTYASGEDVTAAEFYDMMAQTEGFPTTSQPSAGEYAEVFRRVAAQDPDILCMTVSSGLSGTYASAQAAAQMVPEANITIWDTKTLSCPEGWQVEAAGRALQAGWPLDRILELLKTISDNSEGIYTLETLKYLIHGGRISHMKGLLASVLQIRPVIGVGKEDGKYYTLAQERTTKRALHKLADIVAQKYGEGAELRVQLLHGKNPEAKEVLGERMASMFKVCWTPEVAVAPILGAHTGGSLVGLSVGPAKIFRDVPGIIMS